MIDIDNSRDVQKAVTLVQKKCTSLKIFGVATH